MRQVRCLSPGQAVLDNPYIFDDHGQNAGPGRGNPATRPLPTHSARPTRTTHRRPPRIQVRIKRSCLRSSSVRRFRPPAASPPRAPGHRPGRVPHGRHPRAAREVRRDQAGRQVRAYSGDCAVRPRHARRRWRSTSRRRQRSANVSIKCMMRRCCGSSCTTFTHQRRPRYTAGVFNWIAAASRRSKREATISSQPNKSFRSPSESASGRPGGLFTRW